MNEGTYIPAHDDARIRQIVAEAKQMRWVALGEATAKAFGGLRRAAAATISAISEAHRMRALYDELASMNERQLMDMGISRGDIPAVVAGTYRRETTAPVVKLEPKAQTEAAPAEEIRKAA